MRMRMYCRQFDDLYHFTVNVISSNATLIKHIHEHVQHKTIKIQIFQLHDFLEETNMVRKNNAAHDSHMTSAVKIN